MNVNLVLSKNGQRQRPLLLKGTETVIGRQKGCGIRIASHEVSRLHCCVRVVADRVTVRDLGSANGTFVNGQQIKGEHLLKHGDKLQLSDLTFLIEYEQGQELVAGIPVDDFEFVDEVVEGVVILEAEPRPTLKPKAKSHAPTPLQLPALPKPRVKHKKVQPALEEALPDAQVEESAFAAAGSAALPAAEVEESVMPLPPDRTPIADDDDVPFADVADLPPTEEDWVPPWEDKPPR